MKNQEPKITLVTGGNRGIGYAITQCQASPDRLNFFKITVRNKSYESLSSRNYK